MALFNYATKEITLKIVYYGPGLSGKTTNIEFLHTSLDQSRKGKLLSLSTEADRTLFFDFLPIEVGKIKDFSIRFQLYTVPGQVRYNATRKLVLKGADAVVFVADSQKDMKEANIESFENMRENLVANDLDPDDIPIILQFNKRDLPNLMSVNELNSILNKKDHSYFESVATRGEGVHETFQAITKQVLRHIAQKHKIDIQTKESSAPSLLPTSMPAPEPVPEAIAPGTTNFEFGETEAPSKTEMNKFDMVGDEEVEVEQVKGFQDHEAVMEESASKEFVPGNIFPDGSDEEEIEIGDTDDKSIESIYKAFMSTEGDKSSFAPTGQNDFEIEEEQSVPPKESVSPKAPEPKEDRKEAFSESLKSFRASFKSNFEDEKGEGTDLTIDKRDIFADMEKKKKDEGPAHPIKSPLEPADSPITFEEPPAVSQKPSSSPPAPAAGIGSETLNIVLDEINAVARTLRKLNDSMTSLKAEVASISRKVIDIEEKVESYRESASEIAGAATEISPAPALIPDELLETINCLKQDIDNAKKKKLWFLFS